MSEARRLKMRIHRLSTRAARIRARLAHLGRWDEGRHGPARTLLHELIDEDDDLSDEELIDGLVERLDDLLAFSGIVETISDIGIRAFATVAVWILRNREAWMRGRLERIDARIAELRGRLDPLTPRGLGDDVIAELGIDRRYVVDPTAVA